MDIMPERIEIIFEPQIPWKQELRDVVSNASVLSQLDDIKISKLNEIPGLTLAFAPQKKYLRRDPAENNGNGHLRFGGIEGLLGCWACVGVIVVEEGKEDKAYDEGKTALSSIPYPIPLHEKAEIAVLHPEDIPLWNRFYQHINKESLVKKVGTRVFSASGLDRQDKKTFESQMTNLRNILMANATYLEKNGVVKQSVDKELGLDNAFYSKRGQLIGVPIAHVKTASLEGGILVEKVLDKSVLCPGFVIRRVWETKREAYERAQKAKTNFIKKYHDRKIVIPVVSAGQNSLWTKLGFSGELKNKEQQTKITAESLIRFLYLGEDNMHPGPLSLNGLSLPPKLKQDLGINADVVLCTRNRGDMNFKYTTIDGVYGYKKKGWIGKYELSEVDNVGGIIIVPEGWRDNPTVLKEIEDTRNALMRYVHRSKDVNIIPLDKELFDSWVASGKPYFDDGEPKEKKIEITFGAKRIVSGDENALKDGTYLGIFQQGTQIGGVQMALAQRSQGDTGYNIIDMGGVYAYTPQAFQDITARPTTASGLKLELELQGVPMVPGILYPEYIVKTATGISGLSDAENIGPVVSYIRSELVHRFTSSELKDIFGTTEARKISNLGKLDEAIWYSKGNHHLSSVTISHAHDDHDRGLFALDEAPFIMRRQTLALLKAKTQRAATWRQQILNTALIHHPKEKNSFLKEEREVRTIDFNSQTITNGNLVENLYLVGHSLVGTAAPLFTSKDGSFKSVLYTADIRPDPHGHTDRMVSEVAGKPQVLVVESTNPINSNKASVGITERDVKSSFAKAFKANEKKPIIILTPWHNIERMNSILEVAADKGRKVAFGYDHWEAFIQMDSEQHVAPDGAEGFDYSYPTIGYDAALWTRFSTKPLKYQETLQSMAEGGKLGILTNNQLRNEPEDWVIVTAPSRLLMKDFNGGFWPKGVAVIYSSPFPYALNQKWQAAANKMWAEKHGKGTFVADFEVYGNGGRVIPQVSRYGSLAASGHGTYQQNMDLITNLLDGKYKGKEIVVIHGEHSQSYAQSLQNDIARKIGLKTPSDLKITGKLNTYNPANPQKNKGHWIKLD